jgi:hypothetical protein
MSLTFIKLIFIQNTCEKHMILRYIHALLKMHMRIKINHESHMGFEYILV